MGSTKNQVYQSAETVSMQIIINQFAGIGDIIYSMTIARQYLAEGHSVLWPVLPHFVEGLNRAYPDIEFKDMAAVHIDYDRQDIQINEQRQIIPLRWAREIMKVPYFDCMKAKYNYLTLDWRNWKNNAMWERDHIREKFLFDSLGLSHDEPYNLVNKTFRSDFSGRVQVKIENDFRTIEMQHFEGFSIFDYAKCLLYAQEIHFVSSALLFLVELLPITAQMHIYKRLPDENHFENIDYLFTKNYHLH